MNMHCDRYHIIV